MGRDRIDANGRTRLPPPYAPPAWSPKGERVGVRGALRESEPCGRPPHPSPLHSPSKTGVNALMASGEREQAAAGGQVIPSHARKRRSSSPPTLRFWHSMFLSIAQGLLDAPLSRGMTPNGMNRQSHNV